VNNELPSKIKSMVTVGSQGVYEWLVTDRQFDILQICPDVVLGKYIAITSFDSGPLALTDEEKAVGWESRSNIAYSPKVQAVSRVPRSCYEEWYIFDGPVDLGTSHLGENVFEVPQAPGHVSVLVNYGFALHPPDRTSLANLFWSQMERIRADSYVADNDYLTFVSADKALFVSVFKAVKAIS
jgi:hypothetical protein